MTIDNKELVWLPSDLAKKVKDISDVDSINKEILSYIEETKRSMRCDIENIDDDVLRYRAHMINARDSFKKAKDEELEEFYSLWESYDKDYSKVKISVDNTIKLLAPLEIEINKINSLLSKIDTYNIEKVINLANQFNSLDNEFKSKLLKVISDDN